MGKDLKVAALFAGIGGIEKGLERAGFETTMFSECDDLATAVLKEQFPGTPIDRDVTKLSCLPSVGVVTAGFPCQDLSQAGAKRGIRGRQSALVRHLFDLLAKSNRSHSAPRWLVIENVPYMLSLNKGEAMAFLTTCLESLGYTWAYRRVDARSFGVPQRRPRILLVASRSEDPREVLFTEDHGSLPIEDRLYHVDDRYLYGFYWTEGRRGVGWAESAVPPIKGGSSLSIPSQPAVWNPKTGEMGTIDIRDAERLQGFPEGWTLSAAATAEGRKSGRWRLVGNAVCSHVAEWLGHHLRAPASMTLPYERTKSASSWPQAAWGHKGAIYSVEASMWPSSKRYVHLDKFLKHPLKPLSLRATSGYLQRVRQCPYRVTDRFIGAVEAHLDRMAVAG